MGAKSSWLRLVKIADENNMIRKFEGSPYVEAYVTNDKSDVVTFAKEAKEHRVMYRVVKTKDPRDKRVNRYSLYASPNFTSSSFGVDIMGVDWIEATLDRCF